MPLYDWNDADRGRITDIRRPAERTDRMEEDQVSMSLMCPWLAFEAQGWSASVLESADRKMGSLREIGRD